MTRQRRRRIIEARRTGTGLALVATISFVAGMTDAVGVIMSGDFVSFMTGNTTRAAIALGTGNLQHALTLFLAIATFVAGNALGVVVAYSAPRPIFAVLAGVSLVLAVASTVRAPDLALLQFLMIVLGMGMVNATVEQVGGLAIGLTYVTGALSRFGRGIGRFLMGDRRLDWTIQIIPWLGMIAGAIAGALLGQWLQSDALWIVAVLTMAAALVSRLIPRRLQSRFGHQTMHRPLQQRR
ncbi:YoaK family protein [Rhizobium sp. LjRoot30]|uniref:YoaK family protein n=1 Tax=Rhizobium sp. LjRoot30 TaxID=3342320 RepID=UPI003ECE1E25